MSDVNVNDCRSDLFPYIDESLQEQWLLGYVEFLQRHKLWNVAAQVVRGAWLAGVRALSQQSTGVALACGRCGRRTRPHAPCDRCTPRHMPDTCSVCHKVPSASRLLRRRGFKNTDRYRLHARTYPNVKQMLATSAHTRSPAVVVLTQTETLVLELTSTPINNISFS